MTREILNKKLGEKKRTKILEIVDIEIDSIKFKDGHESEKVFLKCREPNSDRDLMFTVSEAWSKKKDEEVVHGLWVQIDEEDNTIIPNSTLGRFMEYADVEVLSELEGKTVKCFSNSDGYLCVTTYDKD